MGFGKNSQKSIFATLLQWFLAIIVGIVILIAFVSIESMQKTVGAGIKSTYDSLLATSSAKISAEINRFADSANALAHSESLEQLQRSPVFAKSAWTSQVQEVFSNYLVQNSETVFIRYKSSLDGEYPILVVNTLSSPSLVSLVPMPSKATRSSLKKGGHKRQVITNTKRVANDLKGKGILSMVVPSGEYTDQATGAKKYHGFLQLGIDIRYLDNILKESTISDKNDHPEYGTTVLLINNKNHTLSGSGRSIDFLTKVENGQTVLKAKLRGGFFDSQGRSSNVSDLAIPPSELYSFDIKEIGWKLVTIVPNALLYRDVYQLRNTLIGIIALTLLIAIAMTFLASKTIAAPIKDLIQGTEKISTGDLDLKLDVKGFKELATLGKHFNKMTNNLKLSIQNQIEEHDLNSRLEREIETAAILHSRFMPATSITDSRFQLESYNKSASAVGGDWFAYYLQSDSWLHVHLGDVTGHGTAAALLAAFAKGATDMLYENHADNDEDQRTQLANLHEHLNSILSGQGNDRAFMTMASIAINLDSGELHFVNSGHVPPFVISPSNKKCIPLLGKNRSLIGFEKFRNNPAPSSLQLVGDDTVFIYTDGFVESCRDTMHRNQVRQMAKLLEKTSHLDAPALKKRYIESIVPFEGDEAHDDITFIAIKLKLDRIIKSAS